MRIREAGVIAAFTTAVALGAGHVLAQQGPVTRDFEAEIQAALQAAKTAAGFEFLGTLVRTCLLPQSGGEDTRDNVPGYVRIPPVRRRGIRGTQTRRRCLTISTSSAARCTRPGR